MKSGPPLTILLVEDDDVDAESVRRFLPAETTLQRAPTLSRALAILGESTVDLVLLDPGLPDSSGVDSFLRIQESNAKTPIVVLTGYEDRELALSIIRHGAQDYLLKNQLDHRAGRALRFAVERGLLMQQIEDEQAAQERLAATLRDQERKLAHMGRVALMGEIVAEITHEVSQPLSVISALTGALEARSAVDPEHDAELLKRLTEASNHAGEILHRLRDFIRDDSPSFKPFDIHELILSTIEFVDYERRRREIEVDFVAAQEPLIANGNRTQIQQVLVNLLRNAFDAMLLTPKPDRRVSVRPYEQDGMVCVKIADHGSGLGISAEEAFTPFTTTKKSGLGMGLAICSRILQNHHGSIRIVPSEGPGTVFQFELPRA